MTEILVAIVVLGALAAILVLLPRLKRAQDAKEHRRAAERARRVRDLAWDYDPSREGDIQYRFRGVSPAGVAWQMHYDSNRSSKSARPTLVWRAETIGAARTELGIGGRRMYEAFTGGVARMLLSGAARVFGRLADGALHDLNEFVREARPLSAGSSRFRKDFVLVARDARYAGLVDADIERLVLDWPRSQGKRLAPDRALQLRLDQKGLHAQVQVDTPSMAVCEHLARLGEGIADRLRATHGR
ncbi:MAG: hypothetical protein LJE97_05120 [Betaproteobacteria bacterium]|jgi:hypothetical protein|nr:hypothetical protein [Betaproteobacteria bacterium]